MTLPDLRARAAQFHQSGNLAQAARLYLEIMAGDPNDFGARHFLGIIRFQEGRHAEALELIGSALAIHPDDPAALCNYALLLEISGQPAQALALYDRALAIRADARGFTMRGNALQSLQRFEEAVHSYDSALALKAEDADALGNRGTALTQLKRFEDALASFDSAIAINPNSPDVHYNRANALWYMRACEDALASYDKALALQPNFTGAWNGRGVVLVELKRFDEALASYDRSLVIDPGQQFAAFHKGMCLLLLGRFQQGWPLFENRVQDARALDLARQKPVWTGAQDLNGKTLFVRWEAGLGDTIEFCRYALLAEAAGAKVILSVQDSLRHLIGTLSPGVEILGANAAPPHFDYYCRLMSLPLAFGTDLKTIPSPGRYLSAQKDRAQAWREKIGDHGFKIGINWQGALQGLSHSRPYPLAALAGIAAIPNVRLISLQKGGGTEQLKDLPPGMAVETQGDDFDVGPDAFADAAAVMENLDLVITNDTSIAHLAGALGRPTWIAMKHVPSWQWLLDRTDSPWYPTVRLFRQSSRDDWRAVFAAMQQQLRDA